LLRNKIAYSFGIGSHLPPDEKEDYTFQNKLSNKKNLQYLHFGGRNCWSHNTVKIHLKNEKGCGTVITYQPYDFLSEAGKCCLDLV